MKRVEVLRPFHMNATSTDHVPGDIIEVSEEQLAKINAISVNMVSVMCDVVNETPKKRNTRKPKEG